MLVLGVNVRKECATSQLGLGELKGNAVVHSINGVDDFHGYAGQVEKAANDIASTKTEINSF
jgi:hypothetical protein